MSYKSNNIFDDIDYCLDVLYKFAYLKDDSKVIRPSNYLNITIRDVRKDSDFEYDKIFDAKFSLLGYFNDKLIFLRENKYNSLIKIGVYSIKSTSGYNKLSRSENVDMYFMYLLSELVLINKLPYIQLPIFNFEISFIDLMKIKPDIASQLEEKTHSSLEKTHLFVQLTESYFNTLPLHTFLEEKYKSFSLIHWKVLSFQILYSLAIIQKKYSEFRHNNLTLSSIYVYYDLKGTEKFKLYGTSFKIPNVNFEIRIGDFNMAIIPGKIENDAVIDRTPDQYYDIYTFFKSLYEWFKDHGGIPNELKVFYDNVLPTKYRTDDIYYKPVTDILTPKMILEKNIFFSEFISENNMSFSDSDSEPTPSSSDISSPATDTHNNGGSITINRPLIFREPNVVTVKGGEDTSLISLPGMHERSIKSILKRKDSEFPELSEIKKTQFSFENNNNNNNNVVNNLFDEISDNESCSSCKSFMMEQELVNSLNNEFKSKDDAIPKQTAIGKLLGHQGTSPINSMERSLSPMEMPMNQSMTPLFFGGESSEISVASHTFDMSLDEKKNILVQKDIDTAN